MHSKAFMDVVGRITEQARKAREAEERLRNPPRFRIMHGKLVADPEGSLVLYEDHSALVARLTEEKARAYSDGKANGTPEYSWRL